MARYTDSPILPSNFVRSYNRNHTASRTPTGSYGDLINPDPVFEKPEQDVESLFGAHIAYLTGGRDKKGGSIIQINSTNERSPDELAKLFNFLATIPDKTTRVEGFSVIIDCQTSLSPNAKSTVRILQNQFSERINFVYILKPNNFWERRRSGMSFRSKTKYKFPFELLNSLKDLSSYFDLSQLLPNMGGSLVYDHNVFTSLYLELYLLLKDGKSIQNTISDINNVIQQDHLAANMSGAQKMLTEVEGFQHKLIQLQIEKLKSLSLPVIKQIRMKRSHSMPVSMLMNSPDNELCSSPIHVDLLSSAKQLEELIANLTTQRTKLSELAQKRIIVLSECYAHRKFENELQNILSWIHGEGNAFIMKTNTIGISSKEALVLQDTHTHFEKNVQIWKQKCKETVLMAENLIKNDHYASLAISDKAQQVNLHWKSFNDTVEERSAILNLAIFFYQKSEHFFARCDLWQNQCETEQIHSTVREAREACLLHEDIKNIYENHFEQVSKDGYTLIEMIRKPIPQVGTVSCPDYILDIKQIRESLHNLKDEKTYLDDLWKMRHKVLTHTVQSRLFQVDCNEICNWITTYGYNHLIENFQIGSNSSETEQHILRHQDFEMNGKKNLNKYSKLDAMSKDLKSFQLPKDVGITENEITKWITILDRKRQKYLEFLNERESILKNSLNFYKLAEGIIANFESQIEEISNNIFPQSVEATEKVIEQIKMQHTSNLGEQNRIYHEATKLKFIMESAMRNLQQECNNAKNKPLYTSFFYLLDEKSQFVKNQIKLVEDIFEQRLSALNVCLNLRVFESDARTHRLRLENWHNELISKTNKPNNLKETRTLIAKFQKRVSFLFQAFNIISENSHGLSNQIQLRQLNLRSSPNEKTDSISHIQEISDDLKQLQTNVLEIANQSIIEHEHNASVMEFQFQCNEICEQILAIEKEIPIDFGESLEEALFFEKELEHLDAKIMKYKFRITDIETNIGQNLFVGHPKLEVLKYIADNLSKSWSLVKENIENRKILVSITHNFHKSTDNLTIMFDLLTREFNTISISEVSSKDRTLLKKFREMWKEINDYVSIVVKSGERLLSKLETVNDAPKLSSSGVDTLAKHKYDSNLVKEKYSRRFTYIIDMISQKKLQADEIWSQFEPRLESINRLATFQFESESLIYWLNTEAGPDLAFDEKVKYSINECTQQLDNFRNAYARLKTDKDTQIRFTLENGKELQIEVATQFKVINKIQHIMSNLKTSWQQFQTTARSRELILEKALRFQKNLNEIKNWRNNTSHFFIEIDSDLNECSSSCDVDTVIKNLNNCIQNSDKKLEELIKQIRSLSNELGGDIVEKQKFSITYNCNMTKEELEKYLRRAHDTKYKWEQIEREKNKERQLVKFRAMALDEFVKTEEVYIRDLETIINKYIDPFPVEGTPDTINNKKYEIFSNIQEIMTFHKNTFLPAIIDGSPNEVANGIIQYQENFEELYINFCRDRKESEKLLINNSDFFEQWQQRVGEPLPLIHQLIKPVQRLPRYKLLLEKIIGASKDLGEDSSILETACLIVQTILNTINNEVDLLHLEAYEGNLANLGKLVHIGILNVSDKKSAALKLRHVFLFTFGIVFTKRCDEPAKDNESNTLKYICKDVYFLEDIKPHIACYENDNLKFTLISKELSKSFILYFKAESRDIRDDWVKHLQSVFENFTNLSLTKRPFFKPKSSFAKIINRSVSQSITISPQSSLENQYSSSPRLLSSSNSTLSSTPPVSLVSSLEESQIPTPPAVKPPDFPNRSFTIALHKASTNLDDYSSQHNGTPTNELLCCINYKPDSNNPNGVVMRAGDTIEKIKTTGTWSWVKVKSRKSSFINAGWVPSSYISSFTKLDSPTTTHSPTNTKSNGILPISLTPTT